MNRMGAIAGLISMLLCGSLFAEDVTMQQDKVEYRKKTVIDFSELTVQGDLTKPAGSYLMNRKKVGFQQLIRERENFLPEMLTSTDNL